MKRDSFVFYASFIEAVNALPEVADRYNLLNALITYALNGEEQKLEGVSKAVFIMMKPLIDANNKRFASGKKGGAPRGNSNAKNNQKQPTVDLQNNQKQPTVDLQNNQKQPNVNVNVNVNDISSDDDIKETTSAPENYDVVFIKPQDTAKVLLADQYWLEIICMNEHCTMDWLKEIIPQFQIECLKRGVEPRIIRKVKDHFISWFNLRKRLAAENNGKTTTNTASREFN